MKNLTRLTVLFAFICTISLVSCSADEESNENQSADLVGVWQRSDAGVPNDNGETHDYKFHFNADQTGSRTHGIINADGTGGSALSTFTWSTNGNMLTVDFDAISGDFTSSYSITSDGQLMLTDLTDLPFNEL